MRISICVGPFGETDFSRPGSPFVARVARRVRFRYLVPMTSIPAPVAVTPLPLVQLLPAR
jgi:hypothetical protein